MEVTENQIYEAFGMEAPEEPPSPAAEQTAPEEPADDQTEETVESGDEGDNGGRQEQTPEQRRSNAARRREAEKKAEIDNAVSAAVRAAEEKAKAQQAAFFAAAGLKNTITGEPITNMDEFDAWKREYDAKKLESDLKKGRLTPEGLQQVIDQNPTVKAARAIVENQQATERQQADSAARAKIEAEFAEIQKYDPNIKGVPDLMKMENFEEFKAKVDKGYTFLDAYLSVNRDKIETQRNEAARTQAGLNARGKSHMTGITNQRGAGNQAVPPDIMQQYRFFNPKATDEEIIAHYNKSIRK